MALARSRAAARRVKDRWKAKTWYKVTAPVAFNQKLLAETLADEPEKLLNRTVDATLQDMTGDFKQMHVKLSFQIDDVSDGQAKTRFIGHAMTSDYVRRLTRRGHSKVSAVFDLRTKDGSLVRVKPFAITDRRAQTTQIQDIRAVMADLLGKAAADNNLSGFLAEILVGDLNTRIYKEARKIHPLRRVEIAKSEILNAPTIEVDETPIIKEPEPEPAPSEEPEAAEGTEESSDDASPVAVAAAVEGAAEGADAVAEVEAEVDAEPATESEDEALEILRSGEEE